MLQILVFGQLTDIIGASNISIEYVSKVSDVKSALKTLYPTLKDKTYAIAVDNKMMDDDAEINEGSVVALLPPFSGG